MKRFLFLLLFVFAVPCGPHHQLWGQQSEPQTAPAAQLDKAPDLGTAPDQAAIDNLKKFLTGSKWNGTFTILGKGDSKHAEEYEIVSAEKEEGDQWVLLARIKYLKKETKVPVPIKIQWLNRTPVIVLDSLTIPGMGTFDARVLIRKGMYAGTWAHGEVRGHMFGEIKAAKDSKKKADASPSPSR